MSRFLAWIHQLQLDDLKTTVLVVSASLLCVVVHETSHGRVALWLGDQTAKQSGRLSWNPLKHIDIFGLIMMAVFKFGWAKAVPINPNNFKHPKRDMAITALAGPVSNLLLALAVLLLRSVFCYIYICKKADSIVWAIEFTEYTAVLSVGLAVFNIIPISPLDGSKVLGILLPDRIYWFLMHYERWGMLVLIGLLFAGVLDAPLQYLRSGILNAFSVITWFPYEILSGLGA